MVRQLTEDEREVVNFIIYFSSGLSIFGSLFIITTFSLFKDTRTLGTKIVFFLSIADFFTSLSWLPWGADHMLCQLQAISLQFWEVSSFLWSLCICSSFFQVFYLEKQEGSAKKWMPAYHLLSWGYPTISVIFCLIYDKFGPAGSWCWIKNPQDPFRLWVYGPVIIVLIIIAVAFFAINIKLSYTQSDLNSKLKRRLSLYLLAFMTSQLPAVANRLQNYFDPENPLLVLFILQAIFQPSQGFINCLVYGFNDELFVEHYKHFFARHFPNICSCCTSTASIRGSSINRTAGKKDNIPVFDYDYNSEEEDDDEKALIRD